jgi:hypothetical protein
MDFGDIGLRAHARAWAAATLRGYGSSIRRLRHLADLLEELPLIVYTRELGQFWSNAHYTGERQYWAEANQHRGLFPFEARAIEHYFPAPPARLFVPGAGAGRELLALRERGYSAQGLEPVAALREAAEQLLPPLGAQTIQEWARAPDGHFDGIVLGWGLWAHLPVQADRLAVLQAFRAVCSAGPVLLSFFARSAPGDPLERPEPPLPLHPRPRSRFQRLTRVFLRERLLGLTPLERGVRWSQGFYHHTTNESELTQDAELAGYRVRYFEQDLRRHPHAVLVPGEVNRNSSRDVAHRQTIS